MTAIQLAKLAVLAGCILWPVLVVIFGRTAWRERKRGNYDLMDVMAAAFFGPLFVAGGFTVFCLGLIAVGWMIWTFTQEIFNGTF